MFPYELVPFLGFALFQAIPAPLGGDWTSLGIGGALAGLMFYFYRMDRATSEKRLEALNVSLVAALEKNSSTVSVLATLIQSLDDRNRDDRRDNRRDDKQRDDRNRDDRRDDKQRDDRNRDDRQRDDRNRDAAKG